MNRIDSRFARLKAEARTGLIAFVTAGDPSPELMPAVLDALVEVGVDLIELGVPFSDPMADGPVIQKSSERALAKGVGLAKVLAMAADFRARHPELPLILMGYLNPIERYGHDRFVAAAAEAGVDGALLVDMPPEEGETLSGALSERGLHTIRLLAPTSPDARVAQVAAQASGFLYYVSFAGITGADHLELRAVQDRLALLRRHCRAPIAVGFGIKDAETARSLAEGADAVVIGSALVARLSECADAAAVRAAVRQLLGPVRTALDASPPAGAAAA